MYWNVCKMCVGKTSLYLIEPHFPFSVCLNVFLCVLYKTNKPWRTILYLIVLFTNIFEAHQVFLCGLYHALNCFIKVEKPNDDPNTSNTVVVNCTNYISSVKKDPSAYMLSRSSPAKFLLFIFNCCFDGKQCLFSNFYNNSY